MYQPVDLQGLFVQFQIRYPASSLITELVQIHEHRFIVRALVQVGGVTLATSMATGSTVELAEDQARSRLFSLLGILPTPGNTAPSDIAQTTSLTGTETPSHLPSPSQPWSTSPNHFTPSNLTTAANSPALPLPPISQTNHAAATLSPASPRSTAIATPEPELDLPIEAPLFSPSPSLDTEVPPLAAKPVPPSALPTYSGLDLEITEPEPYAPPSATFSSSYDDLEDDTVAIDDEFPLEERLPLSEPLPPVEAATSSNRPAKSPRSKSSKAAADLPKAMTSPDAPIDLAPLFLQIEQEMERIHWTKEQGRDHLKRTYGKRSRQQLTDEELLDFLNYLKARPLYEEA
ncbi:hypothetical protein [Pantanalinema sp. GBBB05]|uniref:hypothetical protein n=1 Tax=Pantanalinema sp. GBBB05 TaxID=2604139 RepID=UPI001DF8BA48|nr:hypothetical protein [Pantanalinema sp. GBBB05]